MTSNDPNDRVTVVRLRDLERELTDALTRLRAKPASSRPFVIVERRSGEPGERARFVQFAGNDSRAVMVDVPLVEQVLRPGAFTALPPSWLSRVQSSEWGVFVEGCEPAEAARVGADFLWRGFGVDPDDEVHVVEHADGEGRA